MEQDLLDESIEVALLEKVFLRRQTRVILICALEQSGLLKLKL